MNWFDEEICVPNRVVRPGHLVHDALGIMALPQLLKDSVQSEHVVELAHRNRYMHARQEL
jgi:hypothetical protein